MADFSNPERMGSVADFALEAARRSGIGEEVFGLNAAIVAAGDDPASVRLRAARDALERAISQADHARAVARNALRAYLEERN